MSKRIMISNHNNHNNKLQTQMRNTQQQTDDTDKSLESTSRNKSIYTIELPQHSMTANRKGDSNEDTDEELPPLHERLQWDKDLDDEENSEEIERNRMSYNAKLKK